VSGRASMRLMLVAACALPVSAVTAYAAPKPVAPPHSHHNAVHPVAWPGASSATKSVLSTSTGSTSGSAPAPPAVRRAARATLVFRAARGPVASGTPQRPARRGQARSATQDHPGRPAGWQDAAGLSELRSAASSSRSALLLVAGFALLLLVIAETTFLGFASSRLGIAPVRRRPPEESVPIRRVQLRR
jgi:hypothetical protein